MRRTMITVASSALLFAGCASAPEESPTATRAPTAPTASAVSLPVPDDAQVTHTVLD